MSPKDNYHISFLLLFLICGCNIADSDRCGDSDKFYYDKVPQKCLLRETTDDGGTADSGDDDFPTGLGEICHEPSDCEDFEANWCAISEFKPDGFCTIQNCIPEDCPEAYRCCDCTVAGRGIVCTREADAVGAEQYLGCTCE